MGKRARWDDDEWHEPKLKRAVACRPAKDLAADAVQADIAALVAAGQGTYLDADFYAGLGAWQWHGVPLAQTLQNDNLGRCFDCSALLGVALGDVLVCRGVLARLNASFKMAFRHGWVEAGDDVYDTTWQVRLPRDAYYQLLDVQVQEQIPAPELAAQPQWQLAPQERAPER